LNFVPNFFIVFNYFFTTVTTGCSEQVIYKYLLVVLSLVNFVVIS